MKNELLKLAPTTQFKKDLKKIAKQRQDRKHLDEVIEILQKRDILPLKYRDHTLAGNYKGFRECHIKPDWLLIYRVTEKNEIELLELCRTGSHSELFR